MLAPATKKFGGKKYELYEMFGHKKYARKKAGELREGVLFVALWGRKLKKRRFLARVVPASDKQYQWAVYCR